MTSDAIKCVVEARAPVNIAVIKYWGKSDERLKIPLNDSISGTLSIDDLCTTTTVYLSDDFEHDKLTLNGQDQELVGSPANSMLQSIRALSSEMVLLNAKVHIITNNNFPTAAGLASSAAGYACLAFTLGHAYGVTDTSLLSRIARQASGSACRSLFGGFVQWIRGTDHESSFASQIVDHKYWPSMRVLICVVNDSKKKVSSSNGMANSTKTSSLIKFRAENIVPKRVGTIKEAILNRDFESFSNIVMQESNQFHAICLDTYPPIFYLNETSKQIIHICAIINEFYGHNKVAYTFDAGPNACIYLLEDFVPDFIGIIKTMFPSDTLVIQGKACSNEQLNSSLIDELVNRMDKIPSGIKYLINTSIGEGPQLTKIEKNLVR